MRQLDSDRVVVGVLVFVHDWTETSTSLLIRLFRAKLVNHIVEALGLVLTNELQTVVETLKQTTTKRPVTRVQRQKSDLPNLCAYIYGQVVEGQAELLVQEWHHHFLFPQLSLL